ncbi:MAG TPA: hypothetical protein VNE71_10115 [Myxococcota bacterium]|nr:hypothetical protein [Myxococcota bacterium]
MQRSLRFALAPAVLALAAGAALAQTPQPMTITEVDHVGNRITISGPGVEKRIVDLEDASISSGATPIRVGDLHAGDQVMVDGTLSGTRLTARSVRVVPAGMPSVGTGVDETVAPGAGNTVTPTDRAPQMPGPMPAPRSSGTLQPGAPLPPPSPGGAGRP